MIENKARFAEGLYSFFSHSRFLQALTVVVIGTAVGTIALRSLLGNTGLITILCAEIALFSFALLTRRRTITWMEFAPLGIILFASWCLLSLFWSYYPKATISGILSQLAFTFLALALSALRDTFQIIRALGDVLRTFLALSLVLEIFAGVLIDSPIFFLGIKGNLISGEGIQGLFGSRNLLSIISVVALVTFFVETKTKSVTKLTSVVSIAIGVATLLLSASPVGITTLICVLMLGFLIQKLRKLEPHLRFKSELFALGLVTLTLITLWMFRQEIVNFLKVTGPLSYRLNLWFEEWRIASMKPLEGWGWVGIWPYKTQPFTVMNHQSGERHLSGLNSFIDAWLQVGFVGLSLLVITLFVIFIRTWQTSTQTRNIAHYWPVLMTALLLITSLVESFMLSEFGWFLFTICGVVAIKNSPLKRA